MGGGKAYGVAAGAKERSVSGDGHTGDGDVIFRNELVRAFVLAEIPDPDIAAAVTADELALVGVDDDVVDGAAVRVIALHRRRARVPDLDHAVFRAGDHPFALAVESHAGDVAGVALEDEKGGGIGRADVVQFDGVAAGRGQVAFVGRDAQPVDLGVRMLDRARTYSREGFPETDGMVVAS